MNDTIGMDSFSILIGNISSSPRFSNVLELIEIQLKFNKQRNKKKERKLTIHIQLNIVLVHLILK